jgi:hypothetical protein
VKQLKALIFLIVFNLRPKLGLRGRKGGLKETSSSDWQL